MTVLRALIAEDDGAIRNLAQRMLAELGIEADGAADGLEALTRLQGGGYNLLVTDLDMPRLNGHSLVTALRSDGNAIPIVVISAVGDGQDIVELFKQSVGEYIRKPFRKKEFQASVRRVMDRALPGATLAPPSPAIVPLPVQGVPVQGAPVQGVTTPPATRPVLRPVPSPAPANLGMSEILRLLTTELVRGTFELPMPLPSVAKLVQMRRDPNLSSQAVVNLLSASPNLAAAAVQMANTAFYNRGTKVSNLSQAAIRLGNRTLVNLALTVLHQRFYRVRNVDLQRIVDATWAGTVLTANLTRELSRQSYGVDADDAYLAALFHNVGEMVILKVVDERLAAPSLSAEDLALLTRQCHEQHCGIGARLLKHWEFAPVNVQVALAHHTGTTPTGQPDLSHAERRLVHLLNVALHLTAEVAPGPITRPPDLPLAESLQAVSLSEDRARLILEELTGTDDRRAASSR